MRFFQIKKAAALGLCFAFLLSSSGCASLKPEEFAVHGYHGTSTMKEGREILVLDWLGNIFGAFEKLILWNWKVSRHKITEETKASMQAYIDDNQKTLGDVEIQLNRYAPQDAWRRLFKNKGVKWPYRVFMGSLVVLIADTLWINRLFGFDYYNPYTHTVNLYTDIPSVGLHELGHAEDFAERRYRGSYAFLRLIPFFDLYQEYIATDKAFKYIRGKRQLEREIEAYKTLYPAYGTYVGSYLIPYGSVAGAIVGHIWGRSDARPLERELKARQAA